MNPATENHQDSFLRLHMLAAIWGCCYPAEREFDTVWEMTVAKQLKLADAAYDGAYSFQVEGVLVKFAMSIYRNVDLARLPQFDEASIVAFRWRILRSDWKPEMATPEQWEQLRSDLYAVFYDNGKGFHWHDLKFADLAINRLKTGALVEASSCNKLE